MGVVGGGVAMAVLSGLFSGAHVKVVLSTPGHLPRVRYWQEEEEEEVCYPWSARILLYGCQRHVVLHVVVVSETCCTTCCMYWCLR